MLTANAYKKCVVYIFDIFQWMFKNNLVGTSI